MDFIPSAGSWGSPRGTFDGVNLNNDNHRFWGAVKIFSHQRKRPEAEAARPTPTEVRNGEENPQ